MYELYYYVPWPEYQKYQESEDFESYSTICINSNGYFIQKEWLDEIEKNKHYSLD